MVETTGLHVKLLYAILICSPIGFSQTRPSPSQAAQSRVGAPFLQYVRAYEETPYITKVVFKNGMTALVDEYRSNPVVSIQVYVHAGSLDDPTQSPGMASLIAGMLQRGSSDKVGGSYKQQVHALGGMSRCIADYTTTLFEIVVPSNQWKRALTIQSESILNPSFDAANARMEATLLQNEARGTLDDPEQAGNERMLELAFNQSRMRRLDTLWRSFMDAITPDKMTAFYKAQYTPPGMMLVVSGDVNSSEVLNEVARLYMKAPGSAAKGAAIFAPEAQSDLRFGLLRGDVSAPRLFFGFRTVPDSDADFRALEVLTAIIGYGEDSVLSSRVRDQKKLILSQKTKLISYPEFGYISICATTSPANIDRSEIAILTELELLRRDEPTEAEMERALAVLERLHWSELETVSARAKRLARSEYAGDWRRIDRRISELRKIKPQDVKRVAVKYLRLQNCTLLEYLPAKGEERLVTEDMARRTFAALIAPSADQEHAEREKETVLAVTIPPRAGSFKFSEIRYPFQTASILRGPDLFIREVHTNPLIEMGLFFPGGKLDEKKENGGITKLMTMLLVRSGPDVRQFYRQLEVYGGSIEPVVADDYFGFYVSVLSQNFEAVFKMLLDAIRAPNFDQEAVTRQKEILLAQILSRRDTDVYPLDLLNQALFPDFSYSIPCNGTEAGIAAISPEGLKLWYEAHVKNRKPVVALIGDTKGTSLASSFVRNFSGSRIQDAKLPADFAKSREKGETIDQKWGRGESLILVGFQAPPEDDEDGYAAAVLEGYTGGPGRFSQELRDKFGAVHGISVAYEPRLRGGSLVIRSATGPENEDSALKALREEIQRIRAGPIPFREFRSAVSEAAGASQIGQQIRAVQIAGIAENAIAGKDIDSFQNYAAGVQEVREEDLQGIAHKLFDLEKAVIVILRGTK